MRKLTLLLALATILSCSKEDQECKCDVDMIIVDGEIGVTGRYTITGVPSDCNGNVNVQELKEGKPENHWYARTKNCN